MNEKRNIVSPSTSHGCIHRFFVYTPIKSGLLKHTVSPAKALSCSIHKGCYLITHKHIRGLLELKKKSGCILTLPALFFLSYKSQTFYHGRKQNY